MAAEILENKKNLEHLSKAHEKDRLSHAYIVNGPAGSGKRTFADYIAAALLCDRIGGAEDDGQADIFSMFTGASPKKAQLSDGPCGSCPACVKSMSGNHPDIIYLKREKEKSIQVDEVRRQIIDDIGIKPYYGPYKIYIIEDAQLLTEQAQNALLKTIEEPPEYALIFLLTDNSDAFLDTIRSRCVRLDMERLPAETIVRYLKERQGVPEEEAAKCAAFARGNLGRAMELADGEEDISEVTEILKGLKNMNAPDIFDQAVELGKSGPDEVLEVSRMWFRDVLVLKAQGSSELYFPSALEELKRQSEDTSYEGLNRIMKAIDTAGRQLEANVKAEAVLENMFLAMRRNMRNK